MIEKVKKYPVAVMVFIAVYHAIGIIGLSIEMSRPVFQALIPLTLLLCIYLLWLFEDKPGKKLYSGALLIFLMGFLVEVAGVNTGWIFGTYSYGSSLGLMLFDTPLIMGVNWLLLIYSARALTGLFTDSRWLSYLAGGALMVLYDLALEPMAILLDMWNWNMAPVPIRNYVAWFVISVLFFIIFDLFVKRIENKIAPAVFIVQFMFFVILNIVFYFN